METPWFPRVSETKQRAKRTRYKPNSSRSMAFTNLNWKIGSIEMENVSIKGANKVKACLTSVRGPRLCVNITNKNTSNRQMSAQVSLHRKVVIPPSRTITMRYESTAIKCVYLSCPRDDRLMLLLIFMHSVSNMICYFYLHRLSMHETHSINGNSFSDLIYSGHCMQIEPNRSVIQMTNHMWHFSVLA